MQQDEIKQNTKNTFIYLQKKTKRKQLEDNEWMKPKPKIKYQYEIQACQ